jgi:protein phosphatase
MSASLDFALKSHPGRVRPLNEDAIGADPDIGLFLLADGLGGYNAGEVASAMAVSQLLTELSSRLDEAARTEAPFDPSAVLYDALVDMNATIFKAALNSAAYEGMATTIVVAWFLGGRLWAAHAGDSRMYRVRGGELVQITRDHSFSQELLDAGMVTEEEARMLPAKNLVTKALGASPDLEPEVRDYDVLPGDMMIMCSDGLTEMASHREMADLISACGSDISETARRLVELANDAGGRDNISVVVIRLSGETGSASAGAGAAAASDESPDALVQHGTTDRAAPRAG